MLSLALQVSVFQVLEYLFSHHLEMVPFFAKKWA